MKKRLYFFIYIYFFPSYNANINKILKKKKKNIQQCYNIEVSLEEGTIRELTGKELAEDRVGHMMESIKTKFGNLMRA